MNQVNNWQAETLTKIRQIIHDTDPGIVEERKWRKPSAPEGVTVWSLGGPICTGEIYQNTVKLTFFKGAKLSDPDHLFNSSLEGNARRAIDIHQGEALNETAFRDLIRAAAAHNSK